RRPARDRADDPTEASRRVPAKRVPPRARHARHGRRSRRAQGDNRARAAVRAAGEGRRRAGIGTPAGRTACLAAVTSLPPRRTPRPAVDLTFGPERIGMTFALAR